MVQLKHRLKACFPNLVTDIRNCLELYDIVPSVFCTVESLKLF